MSVDFFAEKKLRINGVLKNIDIISTNLAWLHSFGKNIRWQYLSLPLRLISSLKGANFFEERNMKKPYTIEKLDSDLRKHAFTFFFIAALMAPAIPFFVVVKRKYVALCNVQDTVSTQVLLDNIETLQVIFYFAVPIYCLVLILSGFSLLTNLARRRELMTVKNHKIRADY